MVVSVSPFYILLSRRLQFFTCNPLNTLPPNPPTRTLFPPPSLTPTPTPLHPNAPL